MGQPAQALSRRGLSLAEALVTSFMLLLALGLVGSLANEYSRAMSFSADKDKAMTAGRTVLDTLRGDVEAAFFTDFAQPDRPILRRVRGDQPTAIRLGASPPAVEWDPFNANDVVEIVYRLQDQRVIRKTTTVAASEEYTVATGVWGLKVADVTGQPGLVSLEVTFLEANNRVAKQSSQVERRVGQEPYP